MAIKYCLPIIASSVAECRTRIAQAGTDYDYFEIWIDYLSDPLASLQLAEDLGSKAIFLFRRLNLEKPCLPSQTRLELITGLANLNVLIDFDFRSQVEDLRFYKSLANQASQLICSYHNYTETPLTSELKQLLVEMHLYHPHIYKLACYCNTPDDALRLLQLRLDLSREQLSSIVLGMGGHGAITRIFGSLWGNEMIFAPRSRSQESAPEQLSRSELELIFTALHLNS